MNNQTNLEENILYGQEWEKKVRINGQRYNIPSCCIDFFVIACRKTDSRAGVRFGFLQNFNDSSDYWVPCEFHRENPPDGFAYVKSLVNI